MEARGMQPPSPMQDIWCYQVHACKLGNGCEPLVCNQNTTCDHWSTAATKWQALITKMKNHGFLNKKDSPSTLPTSHNTPKPSRRNTVPHTLPQLRLINMCFKLFPFKARSAQLCCNENCHYCVIKHTYKYLRYNENPWQTQTYAHGTESTDRGIRKWQKNQCHKSHTSNIR